MRPLLLAIALLAACGAPDRVRDSQVVVRFALPLTEPSRFPQVIGVDHDPEVHEDAAIPNSICSDYVERGFPHCYDEHDGSDFILQGGFPAMDEGSTPVVAAADGVVVSVEQDQYDRCHMDLDLQEVSCDGRERIANHVIVEHPGGLRSKYWHLATGSVLVDVGDEVRCGQELGLVGSSGNSSMPHLHFELDEGEDTEAFDPFTPDEADSWWTEQGPPSWLPGSACASDEPSR